VVKPKKSTPRVDEETAKISSPYHISRGQPLPLGATLKPNGINFSVFSRNGTAVTLVLFPHGKTRSRLEFTLDPRFNRTGDIWHVFVTGVERGIEYGYRVEKSPNPEPHIHRFDGRFVLLDPYAKALSGGARWGETLHLRAGRASVRKVRTRYGLVVEDNFDWGLDQPLNIHLADSIIYEMHVRGFSRHPSSRVTHPGSFRGIIEKVPYLKELGVTAVELMPITEFEEMDNPRSNPLTGETLTNFWGYQPISFCALKAAYASDDNGWDHVNEFKSMVKALHEVGIEVILDVVFNHTAEGDERGPTFSFRGFDNPVYYMVDPKTGAYANYSGCGNTMNCNHPVVRTLILDSLRYWVTEMHVDGFRFDLASILGRASDGSVLSDPPLLERIAGDPVLANTKLIAEAWDAAGLYQVGAFPNWGRWAEWNGKYRDDVRRFIRGDAGMVPLLATRLAGSADLYQGSGRAPYHSINFVTSHDGFTLADLVSYNNKNNLANGEDNLDGTTENFSWNCGVEGPTSAPEISTLRIRQMKNLAAILLLSQGVPMILAGDEMARTQQGNNNAYCQDNEISWLNWESLDRHAELFRFFKLLIAFRKRHSHLRGRHFFERENHRNPGLSWHGVKPDQPDWSHHSRSLAMHLMGGKLGVDLLLIANAYCESLDFELPPPSERKRWFRFIDTTLKSPKDICEEEMEKLLNDRQRYKVGPYSVVVLVGR
jgi:isoamylase